MEATEQIKKLALAGSRTQVSATLGPRAYRYATGAKSDTVAQLVERRRDMPKDQGSILASVIFLICSVAFFLSLLQMRSVGMSNFDWG